MALDLEKLSLPWRAYNSGSCEYIAGAGSDYPLLLPEDEGERYSAAVAFAVLASQAFDVMMRRGWGVQRCGDGTWYASDYSEGCLTSEKTFYPDPFTALVEADIWMREREK